MERAKALDDKGHLCRADCLAFSFGSSATSAPWSLTLMLLLRPADVPSHIVRTQPNVHRLDAFRVCDQRKVARLHADFDVLGESCASPVIAVGGPARIGGQSYPERSCPTRSDQSSRLTAYGLADLQSKVPVSTVQNIRV